MVNQLHFLYGDETFLMEEEIGNISQQNSGYSKEYLPAKFKIEDFHQLTATASLFNQPKLIFIKNPWFCSESLSDQDFNTITDILSSVKNSQDKKIIIYLPGKSPDQRKKIVKFLKENCATQEFRSFKDWEQDKVLNWIKARAQQGSRSIEHDAALALEQIGGGDLRHLAAEIDKLITYLGARNTITIDDVTTLSSAGAKVSIFHFNEAMKSKDLAKLLAISLLLLKNGDDPLKLLGLMASNVRFYLQILTLLKDQCSYTQISQILGKNPYFIRKVGEIISKKYSISALQTAFAILNTKDIEIKTGKIKPKAALNLALIKICKGMLQN
ncbi:DNA polymerase III subunit delta [Candidatus Margulisiibacteriota bacterium]